MAPELYWLGWTAVITMLMWIAPGINLTLDQGFAVGIGNRENVKPLVPWAERAKRAHANTVENLVVFAPLVLAVYAAGKTTNATAWAAAIYFWMRLAYYVVYTAGIIGLRTVLWTIAWICQIVLAVRLLSA
jgi:uncharacterized MAPEG superfamily protein